MCGIYSILCVSLNLLIGYGGLFNICHGAFYGIGAYVGALVVVNTNLPFPLDMLLSGIIASFFGLLIGFPSLRLKGDYLALSTYAFAVVIYTIMNNWIAVTKGPMGIVGISRPSIFSYEINSLQSYLSLVVVIVLISIFLMRRIVDSPFGKSLMAIREDETAALASGKNIAQIKVIIFCVGAFFAGIAGNLYVRYIGLADPTGFNIDESFLLISMVIFGGLASIRGSILGAFVLVIFPELLRMIGMPGFYAAQIQRAMFGFLILLIILKKPQGLLGKYKF